MENFRKVIQKISLGNYILIFHALFFFYMIGSITLLNELNGRALIDRTSEIIYAVFLALLVIYTWLLNSKIIIPLKKIASVLSLVGKGNVPKLYQSGELINQDIVRLYQGVDTLTEQLNHFSEAISHNFNVLRMQAERLSATLEENRAASEEIATSAMGIAESSEEQVTAISHLSEDVNDMRQSFLQINETMELLSDLSETCAVTVQKGAEVAHVTEAKIQKIMGEIESSEKSSAHLSTQFKEVNRIVDLINDIAGQINLLSLNASIEAEHAGSSGKGFAVVAHEIRQLAVSTKASATDISGVIQRINDNVRSRGQGTVRILEIAQDGIEAVKDNAVTFNGVHQGVSDLITKIVEVNKGLKNVSEYMERSLATYQPVNKMAHKILAEVQNVSAATEEQSASMEEISSSSESLVVISDEFSQLLTQYKGMDAAIRQKQPTLA
ncbi:MAG: methyl-accepting chemotaxis protein [Sporolactobacillus sp.]